MGISGVVDDPRLRPATAGISKRQGIAPPDRIASQAAVWERPRLTRRLLCDGRSFSRRARVWRPVRPDAARSSRPCGDRGIGLCCSRETRGHHRAIAAGIGVDEYRGRSPASGKAAGVRELRRSGSVVAMVGDGVNDAPALAAADLGIALGSGTDLAMQAAPVVLMTDSLSRLDEVFDSRARTLAWSARICSGHSSTMPLGITLAIAGILNPILAAGAMVLSSLSVIGNSLRLDRRVKAAVGRSS